MIQLTLSQAGYTAVCAAGEGTPFSLYKMYLSTVVVSQSTEPDLSDIQSSTLDCEPTGADGHYTGTFSNSDSNDYEAKSIVITFMVNEEETIFAWGSEDITVPGNSVKSLTFAFSIEIQGAGVVNFSGATTYASLIGSGPNNHPAIGGPAQPVYVNSYGEITASDAYVGHQNSFIYMDNGELKRSEASIGNNDCPVYVEDGNFVPCDSLRLDLKPTFGKNYQAGDVEISDAYQHMSCCVSKYDGEFDESREPDYYVWNADFPALQKFASTKETGKNHNASITIDSTWIEHDTDWWVLQDPNNEGEPLKLKLNQYSYVDFIGGRWKDSSKEELISIRTQISYLNWQPGEGENDYIAYPSLLNKFFFGDTYKSWGGLALHIYNGEDAEIVITSETLKNDIIQGNSLLCYIALWGLEFSTPLLYPKICFDSATQYDDIVIDQTGYFSENGQYSLTGTVYNYDHSYWGYELDPTCSTAYVSAYSFVVELRPGEITLHSDNAWALGRNGFTGIEKTFVIYGMPGGSISLGNNLAEDGISIEGGATEIGEITLSTVATISYNHVLLGNYSLKTAFDDLAGCYPLTVEGAISDDNQLVLDTVKRLSFYKPFSKSYRGYEAEAKGLGLSVTAAKLVLTAEGTAYITCDNDISITQGDALKIKIFSSKIESLKVTSGNTADKKTEIFIKPDQFLVRAKEITSATIEDSDLESSELLPGAYIMMDVLHTKYNLKMIPYGTAVEFVATKNNVTETTTVPASRWYNLGDDLSDIALFLHGTLQDYMTAAAGGTLTDWVLAVFDFGIVFIGTEGTAPSDYFDSFTILSMKREELVIPSLRCSKLTEGDPSISGSVLTPDSMIISGFTPEENFSELMVTNSDIRLNMRTVVHGVTEATGQEIYADPSSYDNDTDGHPILLTASQIKAMIDAAGGGGIQVMDGTMGPYTQSRNMIVNDWADDTITLHDSTEQQPV